MPYPHSEAQSSPTRASPHGQVTHEHVARTLDVLMDEVVVARRLRLLTLTLLTLTLTLHADSWGQD